MKSNIGKDLPSKLYYSISEVAKATDVKAHVLRYWEGEFPTLRPKKTRSGSRRYRRTDIDEVLAIKDLLYTQGFKIAGARKMRRQAKKADKEAQTEKPTQMALSFGDLSEADKFAVVREELQGVLELVRGLADSAEIRKKDGDAAAEPTQTPQKQMKGKA